MLCVLAAATLVRPLRSPALAVLAFPLKIGTWVTEEFGAFIFYHRNYGENVRLRVDNGILKNKIVTLHELYLENTRLKNLLAFKQESPYTVLAARVIGRDPSNWTSVIIVDKGSKSGVKNNLLVITPAGVAGKTIEVGPFTSKVALINDPRVNIPALVQRSRQDGLICGSLRANLVMRYLPYAADIKDGDSVVTSGLDDFYPKGVLLGTVVGFMKDTTGLSRDALVEPAVDVSRLEEVLVVFK